MVLKYLLVNKPPLSKAWRTRLYYYSSGTIFGKVAGKLADWLKDHKEHGKKNLRQLRDVDGLYQVLSDAIFSFMKEKPTTFPNASLSREDFWFISTWKRALTCMFLCRYVLDMPAQKPWNKFLLRDLKFNKRCINRCVSLVDIVLLDSRHNLVRHQPNQLRYVSKETDLFSQSTLLQKLPAKFEGAEKEVQRVLRKRGRLLVVSEDTDSPVKTRFKVNDDSTDDSDNE